MFAARSWRWCAYYHIKNFSLQNYNRPNIASVYLECKALYCQKSISSLFVSEKDPSVNVPLDLQLDLDNILSDTSKLKHNIKLRNISIDVESFVQEYKLLQELKKRKTDSESERLKIAKRVAELISLKSKEPSVLAEIKSLKSNGKMIKNTIKETVSTYWDVEKSVMYQALQIPNRLHNNTPEAQTVLQSHGNVDNIPKSKSHVEIGREKRLIKFSNIGPKAFYLMGSLALLEKSLTDKTQEYLKAHKFVPFTTPHIFNSVIMEASGYDVLDHEQVLTLHSYDTKSDQFIHEQHLKGTSVQSFVAYHARMQINHSSLPLTYFTVGKNYEQNRQDLPGIFGAFQSTSAVMFGVVQKENESSQLYKSFCELTWNYLKEFDIPLRQVIVSPPDLLLSECLQTKFEMWCPSLQQFISVGSVSIFDDFISRRLMCIHDNQQSDSMFVHMVGGEMINISRLIGLLLEYDVELDKY